jgi:hypothetical protein
MTWIPCFVLELRRKVVVLDVLDSIDQQLWEAMTMHLLGTA